MKHFSLDTNLIIALINNRDRLHHSSMKIIKNEPNTCILCISAIKESKKIAREKIARAVSNSLEIIIDIQTMNDHDKIEKELKKSFQKLIKKDPGLKNFYDYLHHKIIMYIEKLGVRFLPRYLSSLSDNIVRTFEIELKKILDYGYLTIDFRDKKKVTLLSDVKGCSSPVRFKDPMDYVIFCELVVNLSKRLMIDFYTDDKEFSKKGKKAYALLETNLNYDSMWLTMIHTDDCI